MDAAGVKRYNKLLAKVQSWQADDKTQGLVSDHAAVLDVLKASSEPSEDNMKHIEAFFRKVQVALGLGKDEKEVSAEDRKKAKKEANAAAVAAASAAGGAGGAGAGAGVGANGAAKNAKGGKASAKSDDADDSSSSSADAVVSAKDAAPLPDYVQFRIKKWDEYAALRQKETHKHEPIEVTLPNGNKLQGESWKTTPLDIAKKISNSLAERVVVAKANGAFWDLHRPLESSCTLALFDFDSPEGAHCFWHSSAHVLGQAIELTYPDAKLCIGPPLEDGGFYYDCYMQESKVRESDYKQLERIIERVIKERQPFTRLVLRKEEALEMFKDNKFKLEIISNKVPDGATCTAYRCGPLVDLCKGPHVLNTSLLKAMAITKSSSAYWLANAENDSLQRIYGISFPTKAKLKEWQEFMRIAEERDHRRIGVQQKLFFFHEWSPGSCFFLPHGARVYNKLIEFIRQQYAQRGYQEVISPNVFNLDLWKRSGHYDNYKENMFIFQCEGQDFGMKPMNCPGHCLMFGSSLHSYRDLPIRMADFGVLHRNEISGALSGLTRVRRFQQDDAHIFCRHDQIETEVNGVLDMLETVYRIFGYTYSLALSTRPEKFLGEVAVWDRAEAALESCLEKFIARLNASENERLVKAGQPIPEHPVHKWSINPADGAFYGPKIDIQLTDALRRKHQCATIQLDFQLPLRFGLVYKDEHGKETTPVIVHRAILGSVERQIAVLIEHFGGKWPFWLSPRQICIVPVTASYNDYATELRDLLHGEGYYVDVDDSSNQLNKKIRDAQVEQYNYILVVGEKERQQRSVAVRKRDSQGDVVTQTVEEFRAHIRQLVESKE